MVRGIPSAALAMRGYLSLDAKVNLFRLEVIGRGAAGRKVESLSRSSFVISVPAFQERGSLRGCLITCAAYLLAFHNEVTSDLGQSNPISFP